MLGTGAQLVVSWFVFLIKLYEIYIKVWLEVSAGQMVENRCIFLYIYILKWQKAHWTLGISVLSCNWFQKSQVKIQSFGLRCLLFFHAHQFHESVKMRSLSDSTDIPGSHLWISTHLPPLAPYTLFVLYFRRCWWFLLFVWFGFLFFVFNLISLPFCSLGFVIYFCNLSSDVLWLMLTYDK